MTKLKRIKYVSEFAKSTTRDDLMALAKHAEENNAKLGITGVLIASGNLFFQVIEGPAHHVDELYEVIRTDPRHRNVFMLNSESGVADRMFPDWSMKGVDLDLERTKHMEPLRAILGVIMDDRRRVETLTGVLERAIWDRFSEVL